MKLLLSRGATVQFFHAHATQYVALHARVKFAACRHVIFFLQCIKFYKKNCCMESNRFDSMQHFFDVANSMQQNCIVSHTLQHFACKTQHRDNHFNKSNVRMVLNTGKMEHNQKNHNRNTSTLFTLHKIVAENLRVATRKAVSCNICCIACA